MTDTGYDPQTDTFRAEIDWDQQDPLLSAVIETVSVATNTEPEALPHLYNVLDVESLEDLFAADQTYVLSGYVEFAYADCRITVSHDGEIAVECPRSDCPFSPTE